MMATFQLEGQEFHALNGGPLFKFTEAISLFVNCETQAEVDELWEKLSAGGAKHVLNVYPPWGAPMNETSDNLLALTSRCVYGVLGSYLTARFAPYAPMRHVWVGGAIGFVLSVSGAIAATRLNLGPLWYPILLVLTALPCAWLGGKLHERRAARA